MIKRLAYFLIILLMGCETVDSYTSEETYIKFYGTEGEEIGRDLLVQDDGMLLLGTTSSSSYLTSILLIKTDLAGNEMWSLELVEDSTQTFIIDDAVGLLQTSDNEIVVLGNRAVDGERYGVLFTINLETPSITLFQEVRAETKDVNQAVFNDIEKITEGGFIIIGEVRNFENPSVPNSDWDVISIKYDESAGRQLERINGFQDNLDDYGASVVEGEDGNFYLFGSVTINKVNDQGATVPVSDIRTVRVNSFLVPVWDKYYGTAKNEIGNEITTYNSDRYVMGSQENSENNMDIIISKLDQDGDPTLFQTIGEEGIDQGYHMEIHPSGIYITGKTNSGRADFNIFIMKISFQGELIWTKKFGFEGDDEGRKINILDDGSILVVGSAVFGNSRKICLLKTDSDGNLSKIPTNTEN
ncbi:hypothetical protein [Flammeovirga agarivorans]|uniref:Lipoprotein n=1 Tax=Flammeovirga agarivorans TaxID=2726742 RepID=A0A7X8SI53_9BACT|nr:hypothetical protein [Flammeovirga agarivorans]NLR90655.1 hypothetical protein [Flammeovirga agarivorans]